MSALTASYCASPPPRQVFDADRWVMHRSVNRYFRHLWDLPR